MHTRQTSLALLLAAAVVCTTLPAFAQSRPTHVRHARWAAVPHHVTVWGHNDRLDRAIARYEQVESMVARAEAAARHADVHEADRDIRDANRALRDAEEILRGRGRADAFDATIDEAAHLARSADRHIDAAMRQARRAGDDAAIAIRQAERAVQRFPSRAATRALDRALAAQTDGERAFRDGRLARASREFHQAADHALSARLEAESLDRPRHDRDEWRDRDDRRDRRDRHDRARDGYFSEVVPASLCAPQRSVEVLWNGSWYASTVRASASDGRCLIGYDGWASSWDEWVAPERLRAPM